MNTEFLVDGGEVVPDCAGAQVKVGCNVFHSFAAYEPSENLPLSRREIPRRHVRPKLVHTVKHAPTEDSKLPMKFRGQLKAELRYGGDSQTKTRG